MDLVRAWLPLFVILAGFLGLGILSSRTYRKQVDRVENINAEILANNRQLVAELREIKEILKDRK
jgi:hypothetical protein